jgi:hypothetical protein
MTCTNIPDIIKACGEHKVKIFRMGDIEIIYEQEEQTPIVPETPMVYDDSVPVSTDTDEIEQYEDDLNTDLFSDPVAWDEKLRENPDE